MRRKTTKYLAATIATVVVLSTGITANASQSYTVQSGDNLSKIAKLVYGDASWWRAIFELNQNIIKDANLIYTGQVLTLPDAPNMSVQEGNTVSETVPAAENTVSEVTPAETVTAEVTNGRKPITPKSFIFYYDDMLNLKEIYYRVSENAEWTLFYDGEVLGPGSLAYDDSGETTIYEGYLGVKLVYGNGKTGTYSMNVIEGETRNFDGSIEKMNYTGEMVEIFVNDYGISNIVWD